MAYVEVFLTDKLRPKVKDDVKVTKIWFPSREKGRYIKAYIYEPVSMPAGPRPVNVNVHGSGFCSAAFFGNSRWFNYCVASKLQCYVIDTDSARPQSTLAPYLFGTSKMLFNGYSSIRKSLTWIAFR